MISGQFIIKSVLGIPLLTQQAAKQSGKCSAVWTRLELMAAINQANHMEVHYLKINKNMEKEYIYIYNSREDVTTSVAQKNKYHIYIYIWI